MKKALHSRKVGELKDALRTSGFVTLDQQAKALGLCRSTTWTILNDTHKSSGLTAATINCILRSPQLPPKARTCLLEYANEKSAGLYGHSELQRRRFIARLSVPQLNHVHTDLM
jgi:oligoribonuclease (3'-5' exoribonuclease)